MLEKRKSLPLGGIAVGLVAATLILPATLDLMLTAGAAGIAYWLGRKSAS